MEDRISYIGISVTTDLLPFLNTFAFLIPKYVPSEISEGARPVTDKALALSIIVDGISLLILGDILGEN